MTGELEEFLKNPLSNEFGSNYRRLLESRDGSRIIWTRVFSNRERVATEGILALTIDGYNLMVVTVSYEDGPAKIESISIGVLGEAENRDRVIFYYLKSGVWSKFGLWLEGGSMGARGRGIYEKLEKQGFFTNKALKNGLNLTKTAEAFITQLQEYINNPGSFETVVAPNIRPQLILN